MFKKIRWYLFYKKVIRKNKRLLYRKHGIKIDWVNRMYKTLTLTDQDIEEIKIYGVKYVNELLEKDKSKIENTLIDLNIHEFVGLMEAEPLNNKQIGIAFRYKFFNTAKITNFIIWFILLMISLSVSYLINPIPKSLLVGLLIIVGLFLISRLLIVNRISR